MKYEYGVEYATNFKNPELSGDVMVEAKHKDGVWHSGGADRVDEFYWKAFSHFRIVDERYKPTEKPNALTSDTSLTHNWFERGELPPGGTYCQLQLTDGTGNWVNCFVIGVDDLGFCVCRADMDYSASMSAASFRPIKAGREKAIEAATKLCDEKKCFSAESFAGELYDAGLLRLPEVK